MKCSSCLLLLQQPLHVLPDPDVHGHGTMRSDWQGAC